jgi:hypothetical protein
MLWRRDRARSPAQLKEDSIGPECAAKLLWKDSPRARSRTPGELGRAPDSAPFNWLGSHA